MPKPTVLIVGCGAAGLSTAGALQKYGIPAILIDKDVQIGGTWTRRYQRLHLHTTRQLSGLAHDSIPRQYPMYISKDQFAHYLQEYARHLDLSIMLGCPVHRVSMNHDQSVWVVESGCGAWEAPVVVIASGQYNVPYLPRWPGYEDFRGAFFHAATYQSGQEYQSKRVLIIGAGNTAAEIATDLVEHGAAFVALSVRTPPFLVPRDLFGIPIQLFGVILSKLPARFADQLALMTMKIALGPLDRYGLPPPAWKPRTDQRIPLIDTGFVRELKRRHIHIRPAVGRFTSAGVVYSDGREEAFDVVIAATGFRTGLSEFLDAPAALDDRGNPVHDEGRALAYQGLYFAGYTESLRGLLFETNRASQRIAQSIHRYLRGYTTSTDAS